MKHFGKKALAYNYKWEIIHPKSHIVIYGREDIIFRKNGFCILEFVNRFMQVHGLSRLQNFRKIEWMILKHMPVSVDNRRDMEEWIRDHWHMNFLPNYY